MSSKRSATTELNHDNWNEENEPEDAGTFTKAAEDVLQKRVVKAARRRLPPRDGPSQGAFGAFTGFKTASRPSSSPFSFLATTNTTTNTTSITTKTSTSITKTVTTASNGASTNTQNGGNKKEVLPESSQLSATKKEQKDEKVPKKSNEYFASLKGLNESVAQWIKVHVDEDPFCILTPIFRDYEKYLKEIETKHGSETDKAIPEQTAFNADNGKDTTSTEKKPNSSPFAAVSTKTSEWKTENSIFGNVNTSKSIFGNTEQTTDGGKSVFASPEQTTDVPKSIFSSGEKSTTRSVFGNAPVDKNPFLSKPTNVSENKSDESEAKSETKTTSSSLTMPPVNSSIFSFGQSSTTTNATAGFSFGSAKPFSFGAQAVKPQDSDNLSENEKEDDDKPPESDFKPIREEGAIYDQRCKVFLKEGQNYTVKGVGTLFIKPANEKTQLIVRADTAVGNVILNTLLTKTTPLKRMNKNSIMIVCVPSADAPQPATVLLRVKTDQDADSLIEALNKHKK